MSKTSRKRWIFLSVPIVLLALLGAAGYCRWRGQSLCADSQRAARQGRRSDHDCAWPSGTERCGVARWLVVRGGGEPRAALRRDRDATEKSSGACRGERRPAFEHSARMEIYPLWAGRMAVRGGWRAIERVRIRGQARREHLEDAAGRVRHGSVRERRA